MLQSIIYKIYHLAQTAFQYSTHKFLRSLSFDAKDSPKTMFDLYCDNRFSSSLPTLPFDTVILKLINQFKLSFNKLRVYYLYRGIFFSGNELSMTTARIRLMKFGKHMGLYLNG